MKMYTKPVAEIEKFTVVDVITESTEETTKPIDNVVDELSAGLEINDEF